QLCLDRICLGHRGLDRSREIQALTRSFRLVDPNTCIKYGSACTLYCKVPRRQARNRTSMRDVTARAKTSYVNRLSTVCVLLLALASSHAYAGFDHELPLDQNGIWGRQYQTG